MKKLLSFILLLTLSVTFTACGDDDEPEKFVWGGDWNDPNDPNYKSEYGGKYNPIQGLWRGTKDTGYGIYYSEDFKLYSVRFASDGRYVIEGTGSDYQINDKAFCYNYSSIRIYKIVADGGSLMFYSYNDTEDKASYYTKVAEQ